ncbi:hypothetical protein HJA73_004516 [Vibrio alginolyticus]|nr:hypothetical protein [Vibrio alginolyticus]EJG0913776.1 hypothetical protein [Vibrio parahaemolyticus]
MKLFRLFCVMFCFSFPVQADEQDDYLEKLDQQYQALLEYLSEEDKGYWESKHFEITIKAAKIHSDYDEMVAYFKSTGEYDDLFERTLLSSSVKKSRHSRLDSKTTIVEELGRLVFKKYYDDHILSMLNMVELELSSLQNAQGAIQLQTKLVDYFSLRREINELYESPIVLGSIAYEPPSYVIATDSDGLIRQQAHDWIGSIAKLNEILPELTKINDSFVSFNKLRVKDPIAYISFGSQIAVLLVAVAGYMISYTRKPSVKVVFWLVFTSMLISFALIMVSSSTLLNIIVQAILPACFVLYWVNESKKSPETDT